MVIAAHIHHIPGFQLKDTSELALAHQLALGAEKHLPHICHRQALSALQR